MTDFKQESETIDLCFKMIPFALNTAFSIPFLDPLLLHFHLPLKGLTNYMVFVDLFSSCIDYELPENRDGLLVILNYSLCSWNPAEHGMRHSVNT